MIRKGRAIVTDRAETLFDVTPARQVHVLDLWDRAALEPLGALLGFALPAAGRAGGDDRLRAIRTHPAGWMLDGTALDASAVEVALGNHGAITAIGGGLIRVRILSSDWRALLMENGLFDAEADGFGPGCCATTLIAHATIHLNVIDAHTCDAYVPASLATDLLRGWSAAARRPG